MNLILVVASLLFSIGAFADDHVGRLTQLEGMVQIFSHASKTVPPKSEKGTIALFEGEYYLVATGKAGDPVENGDIVRTAAGAKGRVVFENGDQYQVGSGTAYRVAWDKDAAKNAKLQTEINLMYGKFRGIVSKDGPRKKLLLRTPVAVMGVRGTDFYVDENSKTGESEFTIIRGKVEVTSTHEKGDAAPKPVEVKAGFSAAVKPKVSGAGPGAKSTASVALHQTGQDELRAIQNTSRFTQAKSANLSKAVAAQVAALEKKALEATLNEIKEYEPELHAKLAAEGADSLEAVNSESVNALIPSAPKTSSGKNPAMEGFDPDDDKTSYQKYFKDAE